MYLDSARICRSFVILYLINRTHFTLAVSLAPILSSTPTSIYGNLPSVLVGFLMDPETQKDTKS
jgi:hypothetical protein